MSNVGNIKSKIKEFLEELVDDGTLGEVQVDDFSKNLKDRDIAAFPAAILTSPQIDSEYFTNTENLRIYTFVILILLKGEDVAADAINKVEDLSEIIMNKFDQNFMLENAADAGVEPSVSAPGPVISGHRSLIGFTVTLRVKATKSNR